MSNSKFNLAANMVVARAKNTHYAVSTFAAVVYALVWLLSNGAHAETDKQANQAVLPAVVVTAYRTMLPEVVVVGTRDANMSVAVLDAIVVSGKRDNADTRVAATNAAYGAPAASNAPQSGYVAKVRNWLRATFGRVSG